VQIRLSAIMFVLVLSPEHCTQRSRLCAVGELTNCPPGTEAKFITKSRSLELMPSRITSAETKAWICTADDCTSVCPNCTKPLVGSCAVPQRLFIIYLNSFVISICPTMLLLNSSSSSAGTHNSLCISPPTF